MTGSTLAAEDLASGPRGTLDEARVEAFAGRLFELYTGGMLTLMVDLGYRTGLFTAAAAGPATSGELAGRADLKERYVREWLGAMTTGGIVTYDPATRTYRLPAEHAACLTGRGSANWRRTAGSAPTWPSTSTRSRGRSGRAAACRTPSIVPSSPT
jgi:hypothetical protein